MKRLVKPVGQCLTTIVMTSAILEGYAIAAADTTHANPSTSPDAPITATQSSNNVPSKLAAKVTATPSPETIAPERSTATARRRAERAARATQSISAQRSSAQAAPSQSPPTPAVVVRSAPSTPPPAATQAPVTPAPSQAASPAARRTEAAVASSPAASVVSSEPQPQVDAASTSPSSESTPRAGASVDSEPSPPASTHSATGSESTDAQNADAVSSENVGSADSSESVTSESAVSEPPNFENSGESAASEPVIPEQADSEQAAPEQTVPEVVTVQPNLQQLETAKQSADSDTAATDPSAATATNAPAPASAVAPTQRGPVAVQFPSSQRAYCIPSVTVLPSATQRPNQGLTVQGTIPLPPPPQVVDLPNASPVDVASAIALPNPLVPNALRGLTLPNASSPLARLSVSELAPESSAAATARLYGAAIAAPQEGNREGNRSAAEPAQELGLPAAANTEDLNLEGDRMVRSTLKGWFNKAGLSGSLGFPKMLESALDDLTGAPLLDGVDALSGQPLKAQAGFAKLNVEVAQGLRLAQVGRQLPSLKVSPQEQKTAIANAALTELPKVTVAATALPAIPTTARATLAAANDCGGAAQTITAFSTTPPSSWGGMVFPLPIRAAITSGFGWRVHPITGDRRFHAGIDLGAPMSTPVMAALSGRVVAAEYMGGYGLAVIVENPQSRQRNLYAHLSAIAVRAGTVIEQGSVLGLVGSTGNSTGPHLHFEVQSLTTEGWVAVNPLAAAAQLAQRQTKPANLEGEG